MAQSDPSATVKKAAAQELAGTHHPSVTIAPLALTQFPEEQPNCHAGTLLVSGCWLSSQRSHCKNVWARTRGEREALSKHKVQG